MTVHHDKLEPLETRAQDCAGTLEQGNTYSFSINISGTAPDKYPAKQHVRRVVAQLQVDDGLLYLMGQQTGLLEDSDQNVPFRQRRYFYYVSGVEEADCHITYNIGTDTLTLYVPDFDLKRAIWMGPTLGLKEAQHKYDVDEVKYYSTLEEDLKQWKHVSNDRFPVYVLHQSQRPVCGPSNLWTDHHKLLPAMVACRVIKDSHEIGLIKRANDISAAAHIAVLRNIGKMANEAEIQGTFLDACISRGARNQSYEIIAASGRNAATLHYTRNNEPLKGKQLVCLDAGAEWSCYASDVTRTFPLSGHWPSEEASNIYSVVQRMQDECISRIKGGVRYLDLHWLAHDIAIEELLRLGILKGSSVAEIRKSGASSVFFPHGLGHHVGLEVHDVSPESIMATGFADPFQGDLANLTSCLTPSTVSAPVLKAGMVVTVEPGIYFSRLALENATGRPMSKYINMDVVQRYMPVGGVRIEDDILVTEDGYVNLTTAPKGQAMLEIIRGTRKD
ncbi:hypothetical protein VTO42DRAFT_1851 [Malbranchea cinnamomea]